MELASFSESIIVRKRSVSVGVEFAEADGVCQTKEGDVSYKVGDTILTGVEGEQWPIERLKFNATYDAIPPTKHGEDGQYRKKPIQVYALQMNEPFYVNVSWADDRLEGKPSDWLLQYGEGDYGIVSKSIFDKTYKVIE